MPCHFFRRSWIWIWEPNCYYLAEKSPRAFMVMFMLESDFRQVCFAVRSGYHAESCPGTKSNRSMGSWGLGVWGGAVEPGSKGRLRGCLHRCLRLPLVDWKDGGTSASEICFSEMHGKRTRGSSETLELLIRYKGGKNPRGGGKALEQVFQGSGGLPSFCQIRTRQGPGNLTEWDPCWGVSRTQWPPEVPPNLHYSVVLNVVCGCAKLDFSVIKFLFKARAEE